MRVFPKSTTFEDTLKLAADIPDDCGRRLIFHYYWNGELDEKHFRAIQSCRMFHPDSTITLWLENNSANQWNWRIAKIADLQLLNFTELISATPWAEHNFNFTEGITFYSDAVRCLLLWKYGGIWLDMDILVLRNFGGLVSWLKDQVAVYAWQNQPHPNNAVFISTLAGNKQMTDAIDFIIARGRGWGFQQANLTYDLPLDFLVLPCEWFDMAWIDNSLKLRFSELFEETERIVGLDNFADAFTLHWHNNWYAVPDPTSIFRQLTTEIEERYPLE